MCPIKCNPAEAVTKICSCYLETRWNIFKVNIVLLINNACKLNTILLFFYCEATQSNDLFKCTS